MVDVPAVSAEPAAISLRDAGRRYGRDRIFEGLNLEVAAGRFVLLRGGNGTGKTTLLRVIATRLRLSSGQGSVFGFDLARQAHEVRRRTVMVSVLGGCYPMLSARENLELSARLYGVQPDLPALLARVGLDGTDGKLVRSFSSGMKKRLGLARLLLEGSRLWLLDEPYSTLDDDGRSLVDELVHEAAERGVTVLMATHEELRAGARQPDAELRIEAGLLSVERSAAQ